MYAARDTRYSEQYLVHWDDSPWYAGMAIHNALVTSIQNIWFTASPCRYIKLPNDFESSYKVFPLVAVFSWREL